MPLLVDRMLNTMYAPITHRDGQWQEDSGNGENPNMVSPKRRMLSRSSNLAVVGFPSSLQPYDFASFPAVPGDFDYHGDTKRGNNNLLRQHGDDLKPQITMVMRGRCDRNGVSDDNSPSRSSLDRRFKDDRCVVDRLGREILTSRAGKDAVRDGDGGGGGGGGGGVGVPMETRKEGDENTNDSRASPISPKPLKFGIEAILAIGTNKEPEKKSINLADYKHRILGRWNGEIAAPSEASSELYGHATGRSAGNKHAAAAYPSPIRPTWSNTSPRPLGQLGSRWEGLPGVIEASRGGWVARDHCPDYHENFQASRLSPYPWARTSDPTIHHCYPLQPTLPPSHPTLPRSFHQTASVTSIRATLVQDNGQDVKANMGVSGGIVGGLSGSQKRKRSWSRAVFTSLQRKGLEKRFEIQKYVNKPERRQLASALGLSDAQVKVWFQNRRMKWRHTQQFNRPQDTPLDGHEEDVRTQQHITVTGTTESDSSNNKIDNEDQNMCPTRAEFEDGTTFVDCPSSSDEDNEHDDKPRRFTQHC